MRNFLPKSIFIAILLMASSLPSFAHCGVDAHWNCTFWPYRERAFGSIEEYTHTNLTGWRWFEIISENVQVCNGTASFSRSYRAASISGSVTRNSAFAKSSSASSKLRANKKEDIDTSRTDSNIRSELNYIKYDFIGPHLLRLSKLTATMKAPKWSARTNIRIFVYRGHFEGDIPPAENILWKAEAQISDGGIFSYSGNFDPQDFQTMNYPDSISVHTDSLTKFITLPDSLDSNKVGLRIIVGSNDPSLVLGPGKTSGIEDNSSPQHDVLNVSGQNLAFELSEEMYATLNAYNPEGKLVANLYKGKAEAGFPHSVYLPDFLNSSGIYIIQMQTSKGILTKKIFFARE